MSSSPDVLAGPPVGRRTLLDTGSARVTSVQPRELRSGSWTRLGSGTVLGDAVTEQTLAGLAEQAEAAARAQGYSRGWAEGRHAAEQQAAQDRAAALAADQRAEEVREAEHRAAVAGLTRAAALLDDAVAQICSQ